MYLCIGYKVCVISTYFLSPYSMIKYFDESFSSFPFLLLPPLINSKICPSVSLSKLANIIPSIVKFCSYSCFFSLSCFSLSGQLYKNSSLIASHTCFFNPIQTMIAQYCDQQTNYNNYDTLTRIFMISAFLYNTSTSYKQQLYPESILNKAIC